MGFFGNLRESVSSGKGKVFAVAGSLVMLAVAGFLIVKFARSSGSSEAQNIKDRGRHLIYYCQSCKASGDIVIGFNDRFPAACPKCAKKTAVAGFACSGCKKIIENHPIIFNCPECGYQNDRRTWPRPNEDGTPVER